MSVKNIATSDKPQDVLARVLGLLRSRNEDERTTGATLLHKLLAERARSMSAEGYAKLETDLINQLFDLVNSPHAHEKLGAILAIEEIIEGSKNAGGSAESTQGVNLANYLRLCFKQISDPPVLYAASRALGKLVRTYGGTLTLETVEAMTVAALEWLGVRGQVEPRRLAGVLVLKELSQNTRAVIFTHVTSLFDKIWAALRDKDAKIRILAVETLTSALVLISERDSRYRFYKKLYEEGTKGLEGTSPEHLHGSLLVLGELLTAAHDFMQDRFREAADVVLRYKDSKDRMVKRTVIFLLPRFVATSPEVFVHSYLEKTMRYVLETLAKRDEFRPLCFISAGEIAKNMGGFVYKLGPYVSQLIDAVKDGMTIRGKGKDAAGSFCDEALTCGCMLAQALGNVLRGPMADIIPLMFNAGLTELLADALKILSRTYPKLLPIIQERLLEHLSTTLTGLPYLKAISSHSAGAAQVNHKAISANAAPSQICLALRTLGSFNFSGQNIFDFLRDHVVPYLEDTDPNVRREAALTCAAIIGKAGEGQDGGPKGAISVALVGEVLEKLLLQAISDPDPGVRRVLGQVDVRFDSLLAENRDALRYLLIALNDEVFEIRDYAIAVIGRLAVRNPAHVLPAVRKTLTHLLSGLEFSGDDRNLEENARLLAGLLRAAQRVLRPYVEPVLSALLPSSRLQHRSPSVASAVLAALGETAVVAGPKLTPHLDSLLPLVLDTLTDSAKSDRRSPALHAMAQFVSATGQVSPYEKYPSLLPSLLHLLQTEAPTSPVRREALRVLGVLGALDPYKAKQIELRLKGQDNQGGIELAAAGQVMHPNMVAKTEDYYSVVAITALMRVLRDPALASHRMIVASTVQYILKSLGTIKSVPLLKYIIPTYIHMLRTSDTGFREPLLLELVTIASIAKADIAPYIDDLLERLRHHLSREYWPHPLFGSVITLIEELSIALRGDFTVCLPTLVPLLLSVIHEGEVNRTSKVLHALEVLSFTCNLEDYLNLVVPVLVSLLDRPALARPALKTLSTLGASLNFSEHASRIILPLSRLLRTADPETRNDVMQCMCGLVYQLRSDFAIFIPIVGKAVDSYEEEVGLEIPQPYFMQYSSLVTSLLKNQPLLYEPPPPPADLRRRMDAAYPEAADNAKLAVNVQNLQNAWEASQRVTRDDWAEWLKKLSVDLLQESSSRALRSCHNLAQAYPPLARELFYAAFFSIWQVLNEKFRALFVQSILTALQSPRIGPDVMLILLNLTEFMEHDDKPLPIEIATLGRIAERCQADAKALHYKEIEFRTQSDAGSIEALIEINNRLQLADSSLGIFLYAQQKMGLELDKFYEKLGRWEDALKTYEKSKAATREEGEALFEGRVRCLAALDDYENVLSLADELWPRETGGRADEEEAAAIPPDEASREESAERASKDRLKRAVAPHALEAAWSLSKWGSMDDYLKSMDPHSSQSGFYRAILAIHRKSYTEALRHVEESRAVLEGELVSVVNEGYERAYATLVKVQQLTELEEVIDYKLSADDPQRRQVVRRLWAGRLKSVQPSVDLWRSLLAVRSLAITPAEDVETWLDFARLCHKSGNLRLSRNTLTKLTGRDPATLRANPSGFLTLPPWVAFAYFKQVWATGERQEAYNLLRKFVGALKTSDAKLLARCSLALGRWLLALQSDQLDEAVITQALNDFAAAQKNEPAWYKGCHAWALGNFEAISHYERRGDLERLEAHLGPAVSAFFNSISLGPDRSLQDVLRLLSLWFRYGTQPAVQAALQEGFAAVPVDTWLQVIPQIIARINLGARAIRLSIADLLSQLGRVHPQALVYPLTVASKSQSASRRTAALDLLRRMRLHSDALIGETEMVSQELIRVSVLWAEHWHASLEEASRMYFSENNFEGMQDVLAPMHQLLEKGPETPNEEAFARAYGRDLSEALEWTQRHARNKTKRKLELAQAWDLYYHVFRSIAKQLPMIKSLHLRYVSPRLMHAANLQLAVPGSYRAGQPVIRIKSFRPVLAIMSSKQRPRKLEIVGSDDVAHSFLLKGHEDIRQDERVMQLFSLVNNLFAADPATAKSHLNIRLFSVTPLSPNSGLIGWVPHCDTLNMLITEYRESRQIQLKIEQRYMNEMMPAYDPLSVLQKVEVFEHGLTSTAGNDLNRVLWLRSQNSEEWLEKRLTYTRSLAVMSMVGYILGLGDRHPSNIMLERRTGKLIHIDFGDCFEVAMLRDKYPERVPFRLTRMLVNALEASGIEGNFRLTCERVMQVLRDNKESLMAVLEAFVYDPLFNMRLLNTGGAPKGMEKGGAPATANTSSPSSGDSVTLDDDMEQDLSPGSAMGGKKKGRMTQPGEMAGEDGESVTAGEVINEKALTVVARINRKLSGRDFGADATGATALSVPGQVERLITQATSVENLCQGYMGWMPFW